MAKFKYYDGDQWVELAKKSDIPSAVTSINGLSGGTLTSPLIITGGDASNVAKISLSNSAQGQITDSSTSTIFGFIGANATTLTVGSSSYATAIRGSGTRPTYNSNDLALYSDIPSLSGYLRANDDASITGDWTTSGNFSFQNTTYFGDTSSTLVFIAGDSSDDYVYFMANPSGVTDFTIGYDTSGISYNNVLNLTSGVINLNVYNSDDDYLGYYQHKIAFKPGEWGPEIEIDNGDSGASLWLTARGGVWVNGTQLVLGKYRHDVTVTYASNIVVSFSFVSSSSTTATYSNLGTLLAGAGYSSTSYPAPAFGQVSATDTTALIFAVYGASGYGSRLYYKSLPVISTSGTTCTISVAPGSPTVTYFTLTSSVSITDKVTAI